MIMESSVLIITPRDTPAKKCDREEWQSALDFGIALKAKLWSWLYENEMIIYKCARVCVCTKKLEDSESEDQLTF